MSAPEHTPTPELREVIAKAYAYRSIGDPHAVDIKGEPRWKWFLDDADKFLAIFGYLFSSFATLSARIEMLEEALERLCTIMEHCSVTDGVCCCGDGMENHAEPMTCGHSPVDHGSYASDQAYRAARAALAQEASRP